MYIPIYRVCYILEDMGLCVLISTNDDLIAGINIRIGLSVQKNSDIGAGRHNEVGRVCVMSQGQPKVTRFRCFWSLN